MKKLKNLFKLSSKVTIYVPSTININIHMDTSHYVDDTAKMLSDFFGGATSTKALGYWSSPVEGLVKETVTTVFAYASETDLHNHIDDVVQFCEELKQELSQESIALEINGEMYFI